MRLSNILMPNCASTFLRYWQGARFVRRSRAGRAYSLIPLRHTLYLNILFVAYEWTSVIFLWSQLGLLNTTAFS